MVQPPTEAVQAPHDEGVALAQIIEADLQLGALADGVQAAVAEDPGAAGLLERVELQGQVLLAGGDAGVADMLTAIGCGVTRYPAAPGRSARPSAPGVGVRPER